METGKFCESLNSKRGQRYIFWYDSTMGHELILANSPINQALCLEKFESQNSLFKLTIVWIMNNSGDTSNSHLWEVLGRKE